MRSTRTFSLRATSNSFALLICLLAGSCTTTPPVTPDSLLISVIGTNDVHGVFLPEEGRGGLATLSGYVGAVRAARAEDGGAVLLIDAGDMWQGTLESNLTEGASVVEAYNAMHFTAAAIGNHEFDFGPAGDAAVPKSEADDPRGALKQRATEMNFPLLAANLIDKSTGELVDWENVTPSVLINVQGIKLGIIGVMTDQALFTTISSNVIGLEIEPLVVAITREASLLRDSGAQLVIVTAHAGSRCEEFDDPWDLSSCDMDDEIMRVANGLPRGLVDHIIAGHTHERIAHFVNGISITSSIARTVTFARTDFVIERETGRILDREIFRPQAPCPFVNDSNGACAWENTGSVSTARYEGHLVTPDDAVLEISMRAAAFAKDKKNEEVGPYLETPFLREGNPESPLGNLVVDAILWGAEGDIAIHNVTGGIRANIPAGELTFGDVYEVFPFDNVTVVLDIAGRDLRRVIAKQAHNHHRRAGIAGMRVFVECADDVMSIEMLLDDGRSIANDDMIKVISNDFLALGGDNILTPAAPDGGFVFSDELPRTRDNLVAWFQAQESPMNAADFRSDDNPRWNLPTDLSESCTLPPPE